MPAGLTQDQFYSIVQAHVGLVSASSSDNHRATRLIAANEDVSRKAVLESYNWNFAIKRASLTTTTTAPVFGFANSFTPPADMLRIIGVNDPTAPRSNYTSGNAQVGYEWKLEGGLIRTDLTQFDCYYVADITDYTTWDAAFLLAHGLHLASQIAYSLTGRVDLSNNLEARFREAVRQARVSHAITGTPEQIMADSYIDGQAGYEPPYYRWVSVP